MTPNAVVTPHRLSARAAHDVLTAGGNAVDAAVAAVAAQGVVAPETCGVGGDLFALIHSPGWERPRALNSSGRAGSKVSADAIRHTGASQIPDDHPAVVTVPGCVDGMETLITSMGRLGLDEVLAPAIGYAAEGFEVSKEQAAAFSGRSAIYSSNPAVSDFYQGGSPAARGDRVSRPDLARVLEEVAAGGRAAFYEGAPGADIIEAVGGLITPEDMEVRQAEWVEPIGLGVFGLDCWTIPPNSQGYLAPATLAVFEMLDPPDDTTDPLWWHLLIEAYRCVAWERDDLVSDPDTLALPADLMLDQSRLQRAATAVDREQAGEWPNRIGAIGGTAYLCVADGEGLTVSIIQSNYRGLGSPFGARRSGFLLQDRGLGFTLTPGHPNELGPGKHPLHTLSPTLWTGDARPRWALGTRGGAVQPQLIAQVAARAVRGGLPLEEAQSAPRWTIRDFGPSSRPMPFLEPETPDAVVKGLETRGHQVTLVDGPQRGWGPVSVIGLDGDERWAAADPRVDTAKALVF